jgi:hypothetical protein
MTTTSRSTRIEGAITVPSIAIPVAMRKLVIIFAFGVDLTAAAEVEEDIAVLTQP